MKSIYNKSMYRNVSISISDQYVDIDLQQNQVSKS